MTNWMPPSRPWSPRSRLGAMAILVAAAWLTAGWPGALAWPAPIALLWLAVGACHALGAGVVAVVRRQSRRAMIEAALCIAYVGAAALALGLVAGAFDAASPCG